MPGQQGFSIFFPQVINPALFGSIKKASILLPMASPFTLPHQRELPDSGEIWESLHTHGEIWEKPLHMRGLSPFLALALPPAAAVFRTHWSPPQGRDPPYGVKPAISDCR